MRHTQFVQECCISEATSEVPCEIFSAFCGLFLLLSNAMQARYWSVSKVGEQVSYFLDSQIFDDFWQYRYFPSIVEYKGGRQPRILVDNFWILRSKTLFPLPSVRKTCYHFFFFASIQAFAVFLLKINLFIALWIFMSNISPHFAKFVGIKLKIISATPRKILTTLFLKFTKFEKICLLLDSPNVHPQF